FRFPPRQGAIRPGQVRGRPPRGVVGSPALHVLPPAQAPLAPVLRGEGAGGEGRALQPPHPPTPLPRSGGEGGRRVSPCPPLALRRIVAAAPGAGKPRPRRPALRGI